MAIEQPGFSIGFMEAAADLSTKQFYCVKPTADKTVNICTAAGEAFLGVLQNKPAAAGEVADIMRDGVTKVMVGTGGLTAGQSWETSATGTAIAATAGKVGAGLVLIGGVEGTLATVTCGKQDGSAGALATNGLVSTEAGKIIKMGSITVSAAQASANTCVIATGLTTIAFAQVQVKDTGNNVVTADADVTFANGNLTVADGATYNTVENYIITYTVYGV